MSIYDYYRKAYKVTTDSRHVEPEAVFFALKGERFDGNDFAMEVAEKGVASLVVADRPSLPDHPRIIKVSNALQALQGLAMMHRMMMPNLTVIAITGTNGKTTTKELVSAVLGKKYPLIHTEGNLNNHIGVPLTLLRITPETRIAVVEMGASHPGEIEFLANIAEPDYGLITNIGRAHLEGFGDFKGVVRTKNELYQNLRKNEKTIFVNSDNATLMELIDHNDHLYSYGKNSHADCIVKPESCDPYLKVYQERLGEVQTKLVGDYNFENVAAAIAVGRYFGVADSDIREAIEGYTPTNGRSQVIEGKNRIIMDAYNANPTSMTAAILNFKTICGEHPLPILGDMRELGKDSEAEHRKICDLLWANGFREALLVGPCFSQYNEHPEYLTFTTVDDLTSYLQAHPIEGKTLLVKGSRGIRLEKALPFIQ